MNETNPHLHNVPIQIAAERGIPALILWTWFIASAAWALWRQLRARIAPAIAAAGLAAVIAMLVAGLFEYNFGDSEFLMLFLGIITLPFAAARSASARRESAATVMSERLVPARRIAGLDLCCPRRGDVGSSSPDSRY